MRIFSLQWTFSLVDRAESLSQASYKILVKRSLRLHKENFSPGCRVVGPENLSPVWATRYEIFSPVDRAESSSQASYKILVKRSLRLHEENFSLGCRAEASPRFELPEMGFSAQLIGLKYPHVIDKKFRKSAPKSLFQSSQKLVCSPLRVLASN